MTDTELALAEGRSPFMTPGEARVWEEASDVLAGERSRDLVAAVDGSFVRLEQRDRAVLVLLAALKSDDALTALGAGAALVRHQSMLQREQCTSAADSLAAQAKDWTDEYRAAQALYLLVLLSRAEPRFQHIAADASLRTPKKLKANAVADRLIGAIALLDAGIFDEQLLQCLRELGDVDDELVQAESQLQIGRALVRRACREGGAADPRMGEAQNAFARAAIVEERTDARLWLEVVQLVSALGRGVPAPSDIEAGVMRARDLAAERLAVELATDPLWAVMEDRFLLQAAEQVAFTAATLIAIRGEPSLGEPLTSLARAANAVGGSGWTPELQGVVDSVEKSITHAIALSLDAQIDAALVKVNRLSERTTDSEQRAFFGVLKAELEAIPRRPKDTGAADDAASPTSIGVAASRFLQLQRNLLSARTGSPLGDEILDNLWSQLQPLINPRTPEDADLVLAALEVTVGFVHDRTADPTSLRTQRRPYLRAAPEGLGTDAREEDVRRDLLDYIQAGAYSYLLAKERGHMDGRTDLQFVRPPSPPLTFETKRELDDASPAAIRRRHVLQAQTYVAVGPRVGLLIVLDLTDKSRAAEPNIRDRFWVEDIRADSGAGDHADYVIVALIGGNRTSPHERKFGTDTT